MKRVELVIGVVLLVIGGCVSVYGLILYGDLTELDRTNQTMEHRNSLWVIAGGAVLLIIGIIVTLASVVIERRRSGREKRGVSASLRKRP